jgi:methylmalonyl-CoA/ethylmalonyl-CoA epimerase
VGIAVENLAEARDRYSRLLGKPASPIEDVPSEKVRVSFFNLDGCRIELLEGTSPQSPVRKFLEKGRSGVHHLSLRLESGTLEALFRSLKESGVEVLGEGVRPGSEGSRVFFVHPHSAGGVLLEFSQGKKVERSK